MYQKLKFRERLVKDFKKNKYIYIMCIPMVLYYLLFKYGPMYGVVMAFQNYNIVEGIFGSEFIGWDNFVRFFKSPYFARLMANTLMISIKLIVFGFPAPLLLALLLNEVGSRRFQKLVQTVTYLPHFISMVVICGMMTQFLSRNGVITTILSKIGLVGKSNLLTKASYFQGIYVISDIWQGIGWGSIIYLAALTSVDEQIVEAAKIDGANRLQRIVHVTIPGIAPTIVMQLILRLGAIMNIGFEKIILLSNEQTFKTADVIASYTYRYGIQGVGDYGYVAAVGMFASIINLFLLIFANKFSRKMSETSIW